MLDSLARVSRAQCLGEWISPILSCREIEAAVEVESSAVAGISDFLNSASVRAPIAAGPGSARAALLAIVPRNPSSMARASSISSRKAFSAARAPRGNSWRWTVSSIAPHSDMPVSSAMRSRVSIVVLPMPRGGVLMTRCSAMESSGFRMSLQVARSCP